MTEKLFQYIWQFQYFNSSELQTINGERIEIIYPGKWNSNQGPDFTDGQIRIDKTFLAGSVELHLKTSHWAEHGHDHDANYKNVILHVVFENDCSNKTSIPVLELQSRISKLLLERYSNLMYSTAFIACSNSISEIKDITWLAWKERLLIERLTRKADAVFFYLKQCNFHWEEVFWWMLARNFGIKINTEAFEAIAKTIPLTVLTRHKNQIHQLEALLFGQAGLLRRKFKEDYPKLLQREYNFLRKKYSLQPIFLPIHFLRMRPGNFPTIRLAQLAALVQNSTHLFSLVLETQKVADVRLVFTNTANDYWHYHYLFDAASAFKKKTLGVTMIDNIIINTVVPVLFAYGIYHNEEKYKNKAICWLEGISAEENSITRGFSKIKIENGSAFDSQALIELKTRYCDLKYCLKCAVGNTLLKTK